MADFGLASTTEGSMWSHKVSRNLSSVVTPPTDLLKGKPKSIAFMPEARAAFVQLKHQLPDPAKQFIVKEDMSEVGLGALLS